MILSKDTLIEGKVYGKGTEVVVESNTLKVVEGTMSDGSIPNKGRYKYAKGRFSIYSPKIGNTKVAMDYIDIRDITVDVKGSTSCTIEFYVSKGKNVIVLDNAFIVESGDMAISNNDVYFTLED